MNARVWVKAGLLVCFVAGIGVVLKAVGIDLTAMSPERVRAFVLSFGAFAPLVYLAAYGQPIVPLPASVMTITGGLAFGPAWGTAAALAGATLRALTQFGVARLLGRDAVAKLLKGGAASLDQKIGEQGFTAVLFIRLIPNLPFDVQNYGLGFSRVRFVSYALATVLGMIPACFAFVYFGYSLTDPAQIWKLGLAVALVAGLILLQRSMTKKAVRTGEAK